MNTKNLELATELRTQIENLRTRPIPLMVMIPLMQRAADALETHTAELVHIQRKPMTDDQIRDLVKECGLDWHRGFPSLSYPNDTANRYAVLVREVEGVYNNEAP